ncbi:MAG: TIGR04086 family membrane protein [Bacillus sp. (in: Bacteria)]|nr:TIGR04086 family membrane protein [Bacillus sp. (in: firmicutes)]MCM1427598.1 TIGR04086 family membrane protein [Eubacterium sp.]
MEKKMIDSKKLIFVLKCMLAAYLVTAGLLLLLALMLYRFGLSEKVVSVCIIMIYIIVTFLAGFIAGKRAGEKKFLWGLAMGCIYFLILTAVSFAVNKGMGDDMGNLATVFLLCGGSGMLGGMLS